MDRLQMNMKSFLFLLSFAIAALPVAAQADSRVIPPADLPSESQILAKAAFEAHGGEKLKAMNNLSVIGTVDLTASAANQAFPASFAQIFAGEKYRLEVTSAFVQFLQVFDGVRTSTVPASGFTLPPINRVGLALLQRYEQSGFTVSDLKETKKYGFRITSPEGYYTDFYIDKKTNRIKGYDSSFTVGGRAVKTAVEIDKFEEYDGIVIPSKFAQRFDVSGMTVYGVFKSKKIAVNGEVSNEMFLP